ncbi:hypothetical protein DESUT3_32790 [Desulfuromonas versatilis]|uniref:Thioredoxin domain-containing protein n=1 Tax=Desulfuromonas versatilis TaxID=2802975 RepID=A0ABM8HTB1_9BACT|nr:AhpC/TSA family protein [Desulfuromonas versatilis]BCR06210.1 hypothetical protein DESUT3_32790 [Desulfuromonas versatilis]
MAGRFSIILLLVLATLGLAGAASAQQGRLIAFGDRFPEVALPVPPQAEARDYLGIAPGESFALSGVKAELVLVELLNVHCLHCQMQTRPYNRLVELIEENPATRGRIKLLAVAVGNVPEEVGAFVEKFQVRFPVLPDPRFTIYRALGGQATPFSIYVRQDRPGSEGVVAGTHLGTNFDHEQLLAELQRLAGADLEELRRQGEAAVKVRSAVTSMFSEQELDLRVRNAFINTGGRILNVMPLDLRSGRRVYTALMQQGEERRRLFAEVTSRSAVCDICHDVHFIYVFEPTGKVVGFEPLHLTKYKNHVWTAAEVEIMRRRVVGTYLSAPPPFDPKIDAVTSATMTSAIIFDSLAQGEALLAELREKGLIAVP